jgi:hypothetical protein
MDMATRGEMVNMLADTFNMTVTAVDVADRALSEAGLRTKSTRGRSATQMSVVDIVNDAIALAGNWGVKAAAPMVARLIEMRLEGGRVQGYKASDDVLGGEFAPVLVGNLSAGNIKSGLEPFPYPRNLLQIQDQFGASFAEILRVLAFEDADQLSNTMVTMIPELPGASIEFFYRNHWLTIRFGEGVDDLFNPKMAQCEGYTKIVLRHRRLVRLAEILKA